MNLLIERNGSVRGIYGEEIALDALGTPRSVGPVTSSPTKRAVGWLTCRQSGDRSSVPSTGAARRWKPRWRGWRSTGWWPRCESPAVSRKRGEAIHPGPDGLMG